MKAATRVPIMTQLTAIAICSFKLSATVCLSLVPALALEVAAVAVEAPEGCKVPDPAAVPGKLLELE